MHTPVALPHTGHFVLDNIRIHGSATSAPGLSFDEDGLARARLTVEGGRLAKIEPGGGPLAHSVV